jgi:hypothetical protein
LRVSVCAAVITPLEGAARGLGEDAFDLPCATCPRGRNGSRFPLGRWKLLAWLTDGKRLKGTLQAG